MWYAEPVEHAPPARLTFRAHTARTTEGGGRARLPAERASDCASARAHLGQDQQQASSAARLQNDAARVDEQRRLGQHIRVKVAVGLAVQDAAAGGYQQVGPGVLVEAAEAVWVGSSAEEDLELLLGSLEDLAHLRAEVRDVQVGFGRGCHLITGFLR